MNGVPHPGLRKQEDPKHREIKYKDKFLIKDETQHKGLGPSLRLFPEAALGVRLERAENLPRLKGSEE